MTRGVLATTFATTLLAFGAPAGAETRVGLHIVVGNGNHGDRYARERYDHDRDRDYRERDAYRVAYSRGYEDGFDHGKDDAEDRDGFNFWHDKDYRNGHKGYKGHYGSRGSYQHSYRSGYEQGYRQAYSHFQHRHDHGRCGHGYYTREIPRYRYWR